jgi:light-regulated signal transduction histidine kinase (bacteriophytochrome)
VGEHRRSPPARTPDAADRRLPRGRAAFVIDGHHRVSVARAHGDIAAAGESGHVWVLVERDGANVLASVEDDGPGVAATERERIFEGFVRLEPVRGPGAGLGLPIARRVAREHGGDLTYADGGGGARFVLRLPAAARAPIPTSTSTRANAT